MRTRRFAITLGLGLLGLILTLFGAQAATFGTGLSATPAGVDEWTPLGGPVMEGGQVNALAVHPAIANTIYAAVAPVGAYDSGPSTIYQTTDGAASWEPVYVAQNQVYALGVGGTHVYAGAFNRWDEGPSIYASHDSGLTWTPVFSFTQRGVWIDISVHPSDPATALVGGWLDDGYNNDQAIAYRTVDGGLTWTPVLTATAPGEGGAVGAVLFHPVTPTIALAAAHYYADGTSIIFRSEDGGATWPISATVDASVVSLAANSATPNLIYAGTGSNPPWAWGPNKVFRSSDAGVTWDEVSNEAGGLLAVEPPSTVYGLGQGLWASTEDGDPGTWDLVQGHWPGPQLSFAIDVGATPVALYVGGAFSGIMKGTNGGVDWTGANEGIETPITPVDIAVDPQNLNKLFVAGECAGACGWMSADGGESWTEPDGLNACIMAFAVNPHEPDIVYAGAMAGHIGAVLRSEDGGLTFSPVYTAPYILPDGSGGQQTLVDVALAASNPATIYAAGWDSPAYQDNSAVVVRSPDDGVSWTEVFTLPSHSEVNALAVHPREHTIAYIGGQDCHTGPCQGFVSRTADGGDSWDLALVTTDTVRSIVIDHWKPNTVYVADDGYWVRKSSDGGDSWIVVRPPWWMFGEPSGNLLAIDTNVPDHVYLGGWGYIAETTDGGETWIDWPLNRGTPGMQPRALVADRGTVTQTLYAGFTGVWAHSREALQPLRVYLPVVLNSTTP